MLHGSQIYLKGLSVDETRAAITEYERIQIRIAEILKGCGKCSTDCKNCPLPLLKEEYIRSGVFYASIDSELKEQYKELVESREFQEKFEEFLVTRYSKMAY